MTNIAIITHIHTMLDRWIDADMRVEIAPRLLFSEIEPIAVLAVLVGRAELAQDIILAWANGTPEAGEHTERLKRWGISAEWRVTDAPDADGLVERLEQWGIGDASPTEVQR